MIFLESIDDDNPPPYIAPPTIRAEAAPRLPPDDAWLETAGHPPSTAYISACYHRGDDAADVRIWCLTVRLGANQCCRASYDEADAIELLRAEHSEADEATIRALVYEEYDAIHAEEQAFWDAVEAEDAD